MSSRSKNGYVASYVFELDIMSFRLAGHREQAHMYIGDDAGFHWGVDKTGDGYEYVDAEIEGWLDRVGAKYSADDLTHIIADKAGWDYKTLNELAQQVVAEDMEYLATHAA